MQQEIKNALNVLYEGGVILYPTDTIWGLGCDATNEKAVQKIYDIKQRTDNKSMLILLEDIGRILSYIDEIPDVAWDLLDLTEDPLTIIYPGAKNLAKNLIPQEMTIGIRITKDPFCKSLIQRFKKPIVSTSANISRQVSPTIFSEISNEIKNQVDYVVNLRQEDQTKRKASGIIQLGLNGEIKVLRE